MAVKTPWTDLARVRREDDGDWKRRLETICTEQIWRNEFGDDHNDGVDDNGVCCCAVMKEIGGTSGVMVVRWRRDEKGGGWRWWSVGKGGGVR